MSESSGPAHRPSTVTDPWSVPTLVRPHRPKVVVKADLLPAVSMLGTVAVLGVPVAFLWSWIAPPERVRVVSVRGDLAPLELESWHRFDDLAVFGFLMLGIGLLTGIVAWLFRERRGPVVFLAAVAGSVLAGWLAMQMGPGLATSHYSLTSAPALASVIELAPRLETAWVLLVAPFGVSTAYGLLTAWNGRDDLGRRLG